MFLPLAQTTIVLLAALVSGVAGFVAGLLTGAAVVRRGQREEARRLAAAPAAPAIAGPGRPRLRDVRRGGLIIVKGLGDALEDVQLLVAAYARYSMETPHGDREWHELKGEYKGRPVGLEWMVEREVLRAYKHPRLRMDQLEDVGLTPEALDALSADRARAHVHEGVEYRVELAGEARWHEDGRGFGKPHRSWLLRSEDRAKLIRVARFGSEPYSVSLGQELDPEVEVDVFQASAGSD